MARCGPRHQWNTLKFGKYEVNYALRDFYEIYRGINTIMLPPFSPQPIPIFDPSRTELARAFYYSGLVIGLSANNPFYRLQRQRKGEVIVEGIFPVNSNKD